MGAARTEKGRESLAITAHNAKKSVPIFPYVCDICERRKEFNRAEYAIRHLKKHAQWYDCNDCGQVSSVAKVPRNSENSVNSIFWLWKH